MPSTFDPTTPSAPLKTQRRALAGFVLLALALAAGNSHGGGADLQTDLDASKPALAASPFGRELTVNSSDTGSQASGEARSIVDRPFPEVARGLGAPEQWCEALILPFNVKGCQTRPGFLSLWIGRKTDQPIEQAQKLDFAFRPAEREAAYFETSLIAALGPMGTRDYRISVKAAPAGSGKTYLLMSYSYSYGFAAKLGLDAYLASAGRSKIGFTQEAGRPIGGARGAIERNAMRYFLALEAHLASVSEPPGAPRDAAAAKLWFDATERHPAQLREMDFASYSTMKREEARRMREGLVKN